MKNFNIEKYFLLLFFLNCFNNFYAFSTYEQQLLTESIETELNNKELKKQKKKEILLIDEITRISNYIRARLLVRANSGDKKLYEIYSKITKDFLGINIEEEHNKGNTDKDKKLRVKYDKKVIDAISTFNNIASNDLKYMFDTQIKFILEYEKKSFGHLSKDVISKAAVLSFLISSMFPVEFSLTARNFIDENGEFDQWKQIITSFSILFADLGVKKDGFLYNDFEREIISKLFHSKIYQYLKSGFTYTSDYLKECKNSVEDIMQNGFKNVLHSFKKYENGCFDDYKKLRKTDFVDWYSNHNFLDLSMQYVTNDDCLFNLFVIGRLGMKENVCLLQLEPTSEMLLTKYGLLARAILNEICKLCGVRMIDWKNLDKIQVSSIRIEYILQNMALFGGFGKIFSKELSEYCDFEDIN